MYRYNYANNRIGCNRSRGQYYIYLLIVRVLTVYSASSSSYCKSIDIPTRLIHDENDWQLTLYTGELYVGFVRIGEV